MIQLGTTWGQFKVKQDADGLPEHGDVLRMIADGWPIEVESRGNSTDPFHLTPAAILTVRKRA